MSAQWGGVWPYFGWLALLWGSSTATTPEERSPTGPGVVICTAAVGVAAEVVVAATLACFLRKRQMVKPMITRNTVIPPPTATPIAGSTFEASPLLSVLLLLLVLPLPLPLLLARYGGGSGDGGGGGGGGGGGDGDGGKK